LINGFASELMIVLRNVVLQDALIEKTSLSQFAP